MLVNVTISILRYNVHYIGSIVYCFNLKKRSLLPPKPTFLGILALLLCNKEDGD